MKRTITTLTLSEVSENTNNEDNYYFNILDDSIFELGQYWIPYALRKLQYEIENRYRKDPNNNGDLQNYLDENWYHLNRMDDDRFYLISEIETEEI